MNLPISARDQFVAQFAARDPLKAEAQIQADLYGFLTVGGLNLAPDQVAKVESPSADGNRRRLDIEIGHVAIEVKKDLRPAGILKDAESQLAGYVTTRTEQTGSLYVGILTDGTSWYLYHLVDDALERVAELQLNSDSPNPELITSWLEAVLSTQSAVKPTPDAIRLRLGASSPAHLVDHATLSSMYAAASAIPEVRLKRELWSKLLRTAFGSSFEDSEKLFVDHTLLVLSAEIIAHAVVGFDVSATGGLSARQLVLGSEFESAQIHGVVQADFFDWVLDAPRGEEFIYSLSRRIAQFDWATVEHDVLKVLYESIIEQSERVRLGEYYTPDWLADRVVAANVTDPLNQKVLDPACGSGTFVFHAVRAYLAAADAAGVGVGESVAGVADHIWGMDIHPVAVTLARVTYLLAIGRDRLNADDRGDLSVPVYLGDSLQWEQRIDVFSHEGNVSVSTEGSDLVEAGEELFDDDLVFPKSVVQDAGSFDRLVEAMADKSADVTERASRAVIMPTLMQFGVHEDDLDTLVSTFDTLRRLRAQGRDHIWGYYVRNLIRPIWLSEHANHVDVLIGNPPWLSYSKMTASMQRRFTSMSRERGLISGSKGASGRDLSTLFLVRAAELYLRLGGRFAFVMPHGILRGQPHANFRSGLWNGPSFELAAKFDVAWDLSKAATGFPATSCVISGDLTANVAIPIGADVQKWVTTGTKSNVSWTEIEPRLTIKSARVQATSQDDGKPRSPYDKRFRQGAVVAPRVLFFVENSAQSPLGAGAGRISVESNRSTLEKKPWSELPSLHGVVEKTFLKPLLLGSTVLPFRLLEPVSAVLPIAPDGKKLLSATEIEAHAALAKWWAEATEVWDANKSGADTSSLLDRVDFMHQLAAQIPTAMHRVVYSASGGKIAAARVTSTSTIVEHKLYWAAASSVDEARYLAVALNSTLLLDRLRPFQNVGLFGPRDIDKNVFRALLPTYDKTDGRHTDLVALAVESESIAAMVELDDLGFRAARKKIRLAVSSAGVQSKVEKLLAQIVPSN